MEHDERLMQYLEQLEVHDLVALAMQHADTRKDLPLYDTQEVNALRNRLWEHYRTWEALRHALPEQLERQHAAREESDERLWRCQAREQQQQLRFLRYFQTNPVLTDRRTGQAVPVTDAKLNEYGGTVFRTGACLHWFSYSTLTQGWCVRTNGCAACHRLNVIVDVPWSVPWT